MVVTSCSRYRNQGNLMKTEPGIIVVVVVVVVIILFLFSYL